MSVQVAPILRAASTVTDMNPIMRMNGPVTQAEYVLPDDEVIITHTEATSRITYANPAFLASSVANPPGARTDRADLDRQVRSRAA